MNRNQDWLSGLPAHLAEIAREVAAEISGSHALRYITEINRTDHYFTYPMFHKTAESCRRSLDSMGLAEVEKIPFPADGKAAYGDWVVPRPWDVTEASLSIIEPVEERCILARYRDDPFCLFMYSGRTPPTGIEAAVVVVDNPDTLSPEDREELRGKFILTSTWGRDLYRLAADNGAVGILCDFVDECPGVRSRADAQKQVRWENYFRTPINEAGLIGFSISPQVGYRLRKLAGASAGRNRPLSLRCHVKSRSYNDSIDVVTAVIPGSQVGFRRPQEILALAHLFEPGANDNASGAGLLLEVARALNHLIQTGRLPRPRRHIRFLLSYEIYGPMAYLTSSGEGAAPKRPAGLNLDMVGENQDRCRGSLSLSPVPASAPSFVDSLIMRLADDLLGKREPNYRYRQDPFILADNFISDPMIGIPTPFVGHQTDRFYHSNQDTVDKVDPDNLDLVGCLAATYLYCLASAGYTESLWIAQEVTSRVSGDMIKVSGRTRDSGFGAIKNHRPGRSGADAELKQDLSAGLTTGLDRLAFARDQGIEAIDSVKVLARPGERADLSKYLDNLKREVEVLYQSQVKLIRLTFQRISRDLGLRSISRLPRGRLSGDEYRASKLVPRRKVVGPITLETLPPEIRDSHRWAPAYSSWWNQLLFWVDGHRSVLDISRLIALEIGKPADLKEILDYFTFLSDHGLLHLTHKRKTNKH
ncbi:M28 family peptidase [candidate division KSB1 bacterium]